jgi:hypothetical protein
LDRLGQMLGGDTFIVVEVGDGAGDFEDAIMGARAQPHAPHRHFERAFAGGIELAQPPQVAGRDVGVIVAASLLDRPRGTDAIAHLGGRNTAILSTQLLIRHGGHFDVQIDAVQQRAAELAQIALDNGAGAAALMRGVAVKSTRAGVLSGAKLIPPPLPGSSRHSLKRS